MTQNIEQRIKKTMSNVFSVDISLISEETSQDNLPNWNSLGHMNLIIALEEEFKITFSDEQIIEMLSFPLVLLTLKEKIVQ